ncbi:hypothetical protein [Rothia mucilaginosa]|jgi:glutathione S-transferase|uniref:hypothetical protein n=1 Tax=Rothia mucilaginosa TaxID=43675 RepID=UPI000A435E3E|nr:hypothetical protein [Rothia mucilaginosa]
MAEESPQNSSRPQVTSQDSGVSSEGQLSNPTGENAVVQSSQKSPTATNQNSQSNKKYDLGVLFVHGIGFQEQGDVFNEIYPAIVNEIGLDESAILKEIPLASEKEKQVDIIRDGKSSSILFRESYWHGSVEDLNQPSGNESDRLTSILLCLSWCIRILCLKFSQIRLGTPIFFASSVVAISLFVDNNDILIENVLQALGDRPASRLTLVVVIFMIVMSSMFLLYFIDTASMEDENKKFDDNPSLSNLLSLERLTKKHLIIFVSYAFLSVIYVFWGHFFPAVILLIILLALVYIALKIFGSKIIGLWEQINMCADYIRSNEEIFYINRVKSDLDSILDKSNRVIVVSHSMGEYLSYKVLSQDEYFNSSNVCLISIGGGLGAVSLIGESRVSDDQEKYSPRKTLELSSIVAAASILNLYIFVYCWSHLFIDLRSFSLESQGTMCDKFTFLMNDLAGIVVAYFFSRSIICFSGVIDHFLEFKFYRYTHFFDPVGNFSNFAYGSNIINNITPKLSFGHGVSTYFFGLSRQSEPGKVEDFKFINMKYMQNQLVKYINKFLSVNLCSTDSAEEEKSGKCRFIRSSIYLIIVIATTVFFEFLGIMLGVFLYNSLNGTNYTIENPFVYMVAFCIFEYWGARMLYALISKSYDIYRPKEYKFRFFWLLVIYPLFVLLIGVWCSSTWYSCVTTLQSISSGKYFS